jgi:hypothetical protein
MLTERCRTICQTDAVSIRRTPIPDADQHNPARRTEMTARLVVIFQHPVPKQNQYSGQKDYQH